MAFSTLRFLYIVPNRNIISSALQKLITVEQMLFDEADWAAAFNGIWRQSMSQCQWAYFTPAPFIYSDQINTPSIDTRFAITHSRLRSAWSPHTTLLHYKRRPLSTTMCITTTSLYILCIYTRINLVRKRWKGARATSRTENCSPFRMVFKHRQRWGCRDLRRVSTMKNEYNKYCLCCYHTVSNTKLRKF